MKSYSVAMCTFNGKRFIREQLLTILNQDPPATEVIIADDGSTDDTMGIVSELLEAQQRKQFVPKIRILPPAGSRLGPTANFERVLGAANTEVIFLADQDDIWRRGRAAAALREFARDSNLLLVSHDARLVDAEGAYLGHTVLSSMRVTAHELAMLNGPDAVVPLCRRNVLPGMTFAMDARLRDIALPLPIGWTHDNWLSFVAGSTGKLRVIREPNYVDYRQHDGNAVGAGSKAVGRRIQRLFSLPNNALLLSTAFINANQRVGTLSLPEKVLAQIAAKAEFERARARLPRGLLERCVEVFRLMAAGGYQEFGSNGNWNVLRDLIHRRVEEQQPI